MTQLSVEKTVKQLTEKDLNPKMYLSDGNLKLRGDDSNMFLVWNIPSRITCLWKTPLCEKFCYAKKAEVFRPNVLKCRIQNMEQAELDTFVADMIDHITWNISRPSTQGKKIWVRIHESGDFYSLPYLKKWISIAKKFPKVHFLAYTKAVRLIERVTEEIPNNLVIRYSIWEDTKPEELEIATNLNLPIYTAFSKKVLDTKIEQEGFTKCLCDCQTCKKCYTKKVTKLAVAIHK